MKLQILYLRKKKKLIFSDDCSQNCRYIDSSTTIIAMIVVVF